MESEPRWEKKLVSLAQDCPHLDTPVSSTEPLCYDPTGMGCTARCQENRCMGRILTETGKRSARCKASSDPAPRQAGAQRRDEEGGAARPRGAGPVTGRAVAEEAPGGPARGRGGHGEDGTRSPRVAGED